jgi:hypothetical protein
VKIIVDVSTSKSVPGTGSKFGYVLTNYERLGVSRPTQNGHPQKDGENPFGLPDTLPLLGYKTIKMTYDLSWWIHEMCCEMSGLNPHSDEAKRSFSGLFDYRRYITNHSGTNMPDPNGGNSYNDHVNGIDLGKSDMQMMPMITGGAYVALIGEAFPFQQRIPHWRIQTINASGGYRQFHYRTHPHLFYRPANSIRRQIMRNGRWTGKWDEYGSEPFSFYKDKSIMPILTDGTDSDLVAKDRIRVLRETEPAPPPFRYFT